MSRTPFLLIIIILNCCALQIVYADEAPQCQGPSGFIDLINRPTIADSPCVVANKKVVLETGYQYQKLDISGHSHVFQSPSVRFGVPNHTELFTILPTYYDESVIPHSGFGSISVGLKHELAYQHNWIISFDGYITPPSGSYGFGTKDWGGLVSAVGSYDFNDKLSVNGQLNFSTTTESAFNGGERFSNINPDILLTWKLREYIQIYGEIYGQSKTAADQGSGFIADTGILYLANKNLVLDLVIGHRISGLLWGVENYIGGGVSFQFS